MTPPPLVCSDRRCRSRAAIRRRHHQRRWELTSVGQVEDERLHLTHGRLGAADDVLAVTVEGGAREDGVRAVAAGGDALVRAPVALDAGA